LRKGSWVHINTPMEVQFVKVLSAINMDTSSGSLMEQLVWDVGACRNREDLTQRIQVARQYRHILEERTAYYDEDREDMDFEYTCLEVVRHCYFILKLRLRQCYYEKNEKLDHVAKFTDESSSEEEGGDSVNNYSVQDPQLMNSRFLMEQLVWDVVTCRSRHDLT